MKRRKGLKSPPRRRVPVTSLDVTGTTDRIGSRHANPRSVMKQRVRILTRRIERDTQEIARLNAAIEVLGNKRKGD